MGLRDRFAAAVSILAGRDSSPSLGRVEPRFTSVRAAGEIATFDTLDDPTLEDYLRGGQRSSSGGMVNDRTALANGTAWRCASIICGVTGTLPCDLMLREDEWSRKPAVDEPFRDVLTVKPNNRQTPSEFKKMMQLHKLQRGNGYAMKIVSRGRIIAMWPLDPNRMQVKFSGSEIADPLIYRYTRLDGTTIDFQPGQIIHLRGLSWDGITGLSIVGYHARETLGLAQQIQKAAGKLFKNGNFTPGFFKMPAGKALSDAAYERLTADINDRSGIDAEDAMKSKLLEEGLEFQAGSLSAVDAQLIELAGFTRDDIGMFYGVPPFLYGDTAKSTSWGTGIEQQKIGFLQFTMEDHITCWTETLKRDCLGGSGIDPRLYVHFDLKGFLRADSATRSMYYSRALGSGGGRPWMTQNQVCAAEDLPKRPEPWADVLPEIGSSSVTENINDGGGPNSSGKPPDGAPPNAKPASESTS